MVQAHHQVVLLSAHCAVAAVSNTSAQGHGTAGQVRRVLPPAACAPRPDLAPLVFSAADCEGAPRDGEPDHPILREELAWLTEVQRQPRKPLLARDDAATAAIRFEVFCDAEVVALRLRTACPSLDAALQA